MCKKAHRTIVTSWISHDDNLIRGMSTASMLSEWISLLILVYLYRNNLFQLKLFNLRVSCLVLDPPDDSDQLVDPYISTLRISMHH